MSLYAASSTSIASFSINSSRLIASYASASTIVKGRYASAFLRSGFLRQVSQHEANAKGVGPFH
jgi:hypothetical protein